MPFTTQQRCAICEYRGRPECAEDRRLIIEINKAVSEAQGRAQRHGSRHLLEVSVYCPAFERQVFK